MGLHQNLERGNQDRESARPLDFITGRFPHIARRGGLHDRKPFAVDYHITQVVDGVKGVHGMIPKAIFITP